MKPRQFQKSGVFPYLFFFVRSICSDTYLTLNFCQFLYRFIMLIISFFKYQIKYACMGSFYWFKKFSGTLPTCFDYIIQTRKYFVFSVYVKWNMHRVTIDLDSKLKMKWQPCLWTIWNFIELLVSCFCLQSKNFWQS